MSPQGGTPAQAGALCERRMHNNLRELPHNSNDASMIHTSEVTGAGTVSTDLWMKLSPTRPSVTPSRIFFMNKSVTIPSHVPFKSIMKHTCVGEKQVHAYSKRNPILTRS